MIFNLGSLGSLDLSEAHPRTTQSIQPPTWGLGSHRWGVDPGWLESGGKEEPVGRRSRPEEVPQSNKTKTQLP